MEIRRAPWSYGFGINYDFRIRNECSNRTQRSQTGRLSGHQVISWILYADDLALFCTCPDQAKRLLEILNETCLRFGLTIAFHKTKTQVFNDPALECSTSLFNIGDVAIENVRNFIYLGHELSNDPNTCFTELRTSRANGKFFELYRVLTDSAVNMYTRRRILEACVRARLTYGTQACFPNEKEMKRLETCWYGMLRRIVKNGHRRAPRPENEYALKYSNSDLEKIIGTAPLRDFITVMHLRYMAHACRNGNDSLVKRMIFAIPKRPRYVDPWLKLARILNVTPEQIKRDTQSLERFNELLRQRFDFVKKKLDSKAAKPP